MLDTKVSPTWCPRCPNYSIKVAVTKALSSLIGKGKKKEDFVIVTDIGCNSKMYDYLNLSGFYGLHGRAIPAAIGIKLANPNLNVICFGGDGGTFNEGISHFIHACRYNPDITIIVHNNQIFSLTTGQATATTEEGFVEKTHPSGVKDEPFNPVAVALECGASFVARTSVLDIEQTANIIEKAISHKGFSFVEILQPCIIYHDFSDFIKSSTYNIEPTNKEAALAEARKWNYKKEGKIPLGIFYTENKPTFEEKNSKL